MTSSKCDSKISLTRLDSHLTDRCPNIKIAAIVLPLAATERKSVMCRDAKRNHFVVQNIHS
ncbi:hypothetical protein J6590_072040 [Homalodisca vitripennis]|nr:hypothetical protein J6590_072040 [Homalodisca vitripennis]